VLSVYSALSRVETFSHSDSLAKKAKTNRKEFDMNQWYARKRHVFVLMTLVGAILMGMVWLAGVPESARAQETLLLDNPYSYKDATPRKVGAGGTVVYTIVLRNDHPLSSTGTIDVTDPLDAKLSLIVGSAAVDPFIAGQVVPSLTEAKFTVFPIAPASTVTLSFQATVTTTVLPGDVITNTATISEGGMAFTRFVTVTVEDYPSAQINEPWNNQLFTTRGTFTIRGRVWTGDEPGFPDPPVLSPIGNSGGSSTTYVVLWTAVPNAVVYTLQESTDPYFSQIKAYPSVSAPTTQQLISNQPRGKTYYYRVKVSVLVGIELYESRWSDVQSVTVNPTNLLFQPLNVVPVMPSVAPLAAVTAPTVEVNIEKVGVIQPDNWQPVTTIAADPTGDWWNWTYNWTLPMEDDAQYDIQVRAKGVSGGFDPEKIDTVRVTIRNGIRYVYLPLIMRRYPPIPYATTLALPSNDTYGNYQLSWSYTQATDPYKPTTYTFQEATNANFTSPTEQTFPATTLSQAYANKAVGTYYYRVRGNNLYGAGPWSNVQVVTVVPRGYFDDFSNAGSGWPRQVFNVDGRGVLDAAYDGGTYRMKILLNTFGLNNRRMALIPAPYTHTDNSYDVEVQHRFVKAADQNNFDPTAGKAGIIFYGGRTSNGTGHFETPYVVEWNFEGQCSISRYLNYSNAQGHNPYVPVAWLERNPILLNWQACSGLQAGYDKVNTARVEMRGTHINVFFNNAYVGTYSATFSGSPHVGLVTGSWDRTPVQSHFDNFRVTER
jgi:uncharacterized repeat protein (TIGR01451 family)